MFSMTAIKIKALFLVQNLLIETIEAKNEFQFKYIVNDLRVNLNQKLECLGNLSIFETVLLTPKSQKFIEICLSKNCSFYKVIKTFKIFSLSTRFKQYSS